MVNHVKSQLEARGFNKRKSVGGASSMPVRNGESGSVAPKNLKVLPATTQIKGLLTFIRNKDTPRFDSLKSCFGSWPDFCTFPMKFDFGAA